MKAVKKKLTKKQKLQQAAMLVQLLSTPEGCAKLRKAIVPSLIRRRKARKKTGFKGVAVEVGKYAGEVYRKRLLVLLRAAAKEARRG